MSFQSDRIPKVIPIDVTDDEFGDDEEEDPFVKYSAADRSSSNIMQRIVGVVNQLSFGPRSGSPSASSMASNSDDNALFESDQEQEREEGDMQVEQQQQQAAVEEVDTAVVLLPLPSPQDSHDNTDQRTESMLLDTAEPASAPPVNINDYIEKLLETCTSLIKTTKESKANQDADNWAIKHGCAFYMSNRFHCYYAQGRECKASFDTNDQLAEHLSSVHHVSQQTSRWYSRSMSPFVFYTEMLFSFTVHTTNGSRQEISSLDYRCQTAHAYHYQWPVWCVLRDPARQQRGEEY